MMKDVAQALRKKSNVGSFTPYEKVQRNKEQLFFLTHSVQTATRQDISGQRLISFKLLKA